MKNRISLLFVFILSSLLVIAQQQNRTKELHWQPQWQKIRVISYNILNALGDKNGREKMLISWLKENNPEVSAFQELPNISQEQFLNYAKQWGHNYAVILNEHGCPLGITSKSPIEVKGKITKEFWHSLLHVKTYGMDFLVTHLNPASWEGRLKEAHFISNYLEKNKIDSLVIMGDLNTHSPIDADYLENNSFLLPMTRGGKESKNFPNGNFDYFTISHLSGIPLIDPMPSFVKAEKRMSFPSPLLMYRSNQINRQKHSERIVFILVSPKIMTNIADGFVYN